MGITYDSRLKEEICRRNAGLEKMRLACAASQDTIKDQATSLKEDYAPQNIVRRNPLYTLLGALIAGGAAAILIKKVFFAFKVKRQAVAAGDPQRVVVEVKGAHEPKVKHGHTAWKEIFDAAMAGIPAVAAFVQQHLSENKAPHNGGASAEHTEAPAAVGASTEKKTSPPFPASISRRSAPPPREG